MGAAERSGLWTVWRQPCLSEWRWTSLGCLSEGPGRQMERKEGEIVHYFSQLLYFMAKKNALRHLTKFIVNLTSIDFALKTANCPKPNKDLHFMFER